MSKNNLPKANSAPPQQQKTAQITASYSGPIPSPSSLREYETICPGAAARLIVMAEEEAKHRHAMDNEAASQNKLIISNDHRERSRGQHYGLGIGVLSLVVSVVAIINGAEKVAMVIGGSTVVGLVTVFVIGRLKKNDPQGTSQS